ncbi:MAG: hypothetical protein R3A78_15660 [Polyangiales bacterium]
METSHVKSLARGLFANLILLALVATCGWLAWHHWMILLWGLPFIHLAAGLVPGAWWRRDAPLPRAETELERRRSVWNVLSELYLDTELDGRDCARIAAVLAKSGYTVGQLEEILYRELHPVLHANLLSVAGEWAGFDLDWLEARIVQPGVHRASVALIPGKWMVQSGWAAIRAELRAWH